MHQHDLMMPTPVQPLLAILSTPLSIEISIKFTISITLCINMHNMIITVATQGLWLIVVQMAVCLGQILMSFPPYPMLIDITGVGGDVMEHLPLVQCTSLIETINEGNIIILMSQYAHKPDSKTIHSKLQLEHFGGLAYDSVKTAPTYCYP